MIVNLDALLALSISRATDYRPTRLLTPLRSTQQIRRITSGPPETCRGGLCGRIPQLADVEEPVVQPPPVVEPPDPPTVFDSEVFFPVGPD